ncbi:MAG: hypothetical protein COA90_04130 [Gammaproteobacteria bacterium]|nr:MAG: hypothetical protein COA90_04130 [Gammaproteobacteria bacterium]
MSRYKKNWALDGWPVEDTEAKAVLHTDDLVEVLNRQEVSLVSAKKEMTELKTEINELKASNEQIREFLAAFTEDYKTEIDGKYTDEDLVYPAKKRAKNNDMFFIDLADAILKKTPKQSLAEIHAEAVEDAVTSVPKNFTAKHESKWTIDVSVLKEKAQQLRDSVKEGE